MKNNFKDLLTMTQDELLMELPDYLEACGYTDLTITDYAIGALSPLDNQPMLVAHLDTINTKKSSDKAVDKPTTTNSYYGSYYGNKTDVEKTPTVNDILFTDKYILLSPEANEDISCLGGDDRVGVKTILDMLELGYKPNILFTTNEESGCVGSRELILDDLFDDFKKATCLIQVDRGQHEDSWNEMVFYQFDYKKAWSEAFDELSKYYTLAFGSYTDVAVLGSFFNKPIVNLSASYMNEHTRDEFINLEAYAKNLEGLSMFYKWCVSQDTSNWEYKQKEYPKVTSSYTPYRKVNIMESTVEFFYKQDNKDYTPDFYPAEVEVAPQDDTLSSKLVCLYPNNYYELDDLINKFVKVSNSNLEDIESYVDDAVAWGVKISTLSDLFSLLKGDFSTWVDDYLEDFEV